MKEQSFMKAMFHGIIADDLAFPYPELPGEDRENLSLMLESVRRFLADKVDAAKIDREHQIPAEVLQEAKALGLFGLQIPTELGGIGLSAMASSRVTQEIASHDASLAVTLGAHQSIGLKAIQLFGSDEQKRRFLPALASGERVAAFALTEPVAGSDAAAIKTRADRSADGRHYVLNGSKIWITNGAFADVFTVFARTSDFDSQKPKLTAFVVERGEGVKTGPNELKLGIRGSATNSVYFDDVSVPTENVLGDVGRGFKVAMEVLNSGRLGLAAGCTGSCRRLVQMAVERVQERRAFGRAIGEFGLIKDKIALMLAQTYALESATYLTAGLIDAKVSDYSLESAICKVLGSETLWWVVNETLQIAAGIGYMEEYPYERMLRDARINLIFEGTNEILRCFIALSGMAGPGEKLAEVAKALREPIKGFGLLRDFAISKARGMLVPERMERAHPLLGREAVIVEEFAAMLARQVDNTLRKHGRNIAEMQYVQRRLAEMAIDLYALSACISRATQAIEKGGEEGARRHIDWTRIFGAQCRRHLQQIVQEFEQNDDELRKECAYRGYADGGYGLDIL